MVSLVRRLPTLAATAALCATLAAPTQAQVNTGEFSAGGLDLFWDALDGQVDNPAVGSDAFVIDPADQHPAWISPPADSRWITRLAGWEEDAPDDIWTTYFMSFTVANPGGYSIAGNWASDNNSRMLINGAEVGTLGFTSFGALTPFTVNSGFVSGSNTLAVQVFNGSGSGNPSGLLVSDLEASVVVPEPTSVVLLGTGLFGLGIVARRRREDEAED